MTTTNVRQDAGRQSREICAKSGKYLRIPQKGYKVLLAVSHSSTGEIQMSKFAKFVNTAKVAGGFASW